MSAEYLIVPTDELEAVNAILATIRETPVDSLESGASDADIALALLRAVSKQFQTTGWTFNTDKEVTLAINNDGEVPLPANVLRVISQDPNHVQRGLKLYDRSLHTYQFTTAPVADLVTGLSFDLLPEPARAFITVRAARRFVDRSENDQVAHSFTVQDEVSAWSSWLNYEAEIAQWNVLTATGSLSQRMKQYR